MPKSHKRWTSYELMLKRVKKRSYIIGECWCYDPMGLWGILPRQNWIKDWILRTTLVRDRRDPVIIAADREVRAINRAQRAEVQALVLALTMVFHPRLGEDSLWHDLPAVLMRMIVCEAYITRLDI